MEGRKTVTVTVTAKGEVKVNINGIIGESCQKIAEIAMKHLGNYDSIELKDEFFMQEVNVSSENIAALFVIPGSR